MWRFIETGNCSRLQRTTGGISTPSTGWVPAGTSRGAVRRPRQRPFARTNPQWSSDPSHFAMPEVAVTHRVRVYSTDDPRVFPQGTRAARSMKSIRSIRARLRCSWRTSGRHELDIASARCRYCRREWSVLYPSRSTSVTTKRGGTGTTHATATGLVARAARAAVQLLWRTHRNSTAHADPASPVR